MPVERTREMTSVYATILSRDNKIKRNPPRRAVSRVCFGKKKICKFDGTKSMKITKLAH